MSRAITTQTPTIANPRRRSAPFCLLRIWSIFAWRSDLAVLATSGFLGVVVGRVEWVCRGQSLRSGRSEPETVCVRCVGGGLDRAPAEGERERPRPSGPRLPTRPPTRPPTRTEASGRTVRMAAASSSGSAGAPNAGWSSSSPRRARTTASRAPYPKRSAPSGRTSAEAPVPCSPGGRTRSSRPRTTAIGRAASLPCASSAAPASSSATAGAVTASSLPCASTEPARSTSTRSPAAPIAMSVCPSRQARPAVSVTTHADVAAGPRRGRTRGSPAPTRRGPPAAAPRCPGPRWRRRCRPRPG